MFYRSIVIAASMALSMTTLAQDVVFESCANPEDISLEAVVKWHWQGSTVMPAHKQVMGTPVVVPLEDTNGDGKVNQHDIPSVVFNTYAGSAYTSNGVLRAISGKDGSELWTVTNSAYRTFPTSSIATADIDQDGLVEIVSHKAGRGLIAFEHTGEFKWLSNSTPFSTGGIYIANLDADGRPEILVGNTILNADGTLRWRASGSYTGQTFATVADLNLDNKPEVILGASAYSNMGELLWQNKQVGDGKTAIGNFDTDNYPEIVVVKSGRVYLLSHQGELIWGPVKIPNGGRGGSPTIADLDGDNAVEIGIAGAHNYVAVDTDGKILWQSSTRDTSSSQTGSSVFDFNGDGQADVVYNDEQYLRIYRGFDGKELFKVRNTSDTVHELPVIADIDNDNHADIVVASNSSTFGYNHGVIAFQGKNNDWMNTRKIWNQHAYSITNINDDGTVPRIAKPSWLNNNTFRSIPFLSKSGKTCIRPATCEIYAVHDKGLNDTQFFKISFDENITNIAQYLSGTTLTSPTELLDELDDTTDIADYLGDTTLTSPTELLTELYADFSANTIKYKQVKPLGGVYAGFDIEAIAIHPQTNIIYAASGNDTEGDIPKGHLYALDAKIGKLHAIGATGFDEIGDLAFAPDGTLYGYAKGQGIITIDTATGKGEIWIAAEQMVEGLTLAKGTEQPLFYGAVDKTLWVFDAATGELRIQCENLSGETEALEMLNDSLLLFTIHRDNPPMIHFFDVNTCQALPTLEIPLYRFNDVEGLAMSTTACE